MNVISNLTRKERYPVDKVLSQIKPMRKKKSKPNARVEFDGDLIKMDSHRYHCFLTSGLKCVKCGIEGLYFTKEKHGNNLTFHFNLYAVSENDEEILMTKDHILPKSKGGKDELSNYQTMCFNCNGEKGNEIEE